MSRRYLILVSITLIALGIFAVVFGTEYMNCPHPIGSTSTMDGFCVVANTGIMGPGVVILVLGVVILIISLLPHQEPRR